MFFFFFLALAQYILKVFNQRLITVCIGWAYKGGSKNSFQSADSRTQTGEHIQLSSLQIPWNQEPNQLSQPPWLDSYIFYFSFENLFMSHMELKICSHLLIELSTSCHHHPKQKIKNKKMRKKKKKSHVRWFPLN